MPERKSGGEALKYVMVFAVLFAIGIFAVWSMTGQFFGIQPEEPEFVEQGDYVKIYLKGWYANGSDFDSLFFEFRVGRGQIILKGIDEGILGMKIGEKRILNLTPDMAFGEYDSELVTEKSKIEIIDSIQTFYITPEQFNATFGGMPEEGMIVSSVDLPWRRVEILNFTDTTMTWKLMPPEGLKAGWPLDCTDSSRAVPTAMDCHGVATMNIIEDGEKIEIAIEPFIGENVILNGVKARIVDSSKESTFYLDRNHKYAGQSFIYEIELLDLEKG